MTKKSSHPELVSGPPQDGSAKFTMRPICINADLYDGVLKQVQHDKESFYRTGVRKVHNAFDEHDPDLYDRVLK